MSKFEPCFAGINQWTGKFRGYVAKNIQTGEEFVSFPFRLQSHPGYASLRCWAACDALNGLPADPIIAAELARAYEYCVFDGDEIVARKGGFSSSTGAKKAGLKAALAFQVEG